jgi:hypothetical protein
MTSAMRMVQRAVTCNFCVQLVKTPTETKKKKKRWRDQRNIRYCQDDGCTSGINVFQQEFVI